MKNFNAFQLAVIAGFLILLMGGVAIFAVFGGSARQNIGTVVVWGTIDRDIMEHMLIELVAQDKSFQDVSYVEKKPETYNQELTEAIAKGTAPDLAMVTDQDIISFSGKLTPISYDQITQRQFLDSFIDEGSMFLSSDGIVGLPFTIDPMVMYYNRDLFAGAGISTYPKTWTEVQAIAPRMTSLDGASNVKRSSVAIGTYSNVRHAKEILVSLFMQAGDRLVARNADGQLASVFGTNQTQGVENPAEAVLRYYTSFANPSQTSYSWNRSLPDSFNAFVAGDVGVYFGFASEYQTIVARNPNLAIGVATLPQTSVSRSPVTYGRMTVLAIPRAAKNPQGAALIADKFTQAAAISIVSAKSGLPPVRRDTIADTPGDSVGSVFAQSALIARSWYDPSPQKTDSIFMSMVDSVISGRERLGDAVRTAQDALSEIFNQLQQGQ